MPNNNKAIFFARTIGRGRCGKNVHKCEPVAGDIVTIEGYEQLYFIAHQTAGGKWVITESARGRHDYAVYGDTKEDAIAQVKKLLDQYPENGDDFYCDAALDAKSHGRMIRSSIRCAMQNTWHTKQNSQAVENAEQSKGGDHANTAEQLIYEALDIARTMPKKQMMKELGFWRKILMKSFVML
jgi:hypothetical protein